MIDGNIKINIPVPVKEILNRLQENGYEAYIVGGCVRDALLGREPKDWDITTSALPEEVKSLFHNTVDTGIQHGTVMVIRQGEGYEVTTYRVDGEYKDGRHPSSVTFTRSLAEDLKRRDFTINAFAWDENGLIDMFNGLDDLENGIIRCVGNPDERFNEDALRIMRAVRFSAQLGFAIETETRAMIGKYRKRLADISMERIRVEFEKTLLSSAPEIVNDYRQLGLAPYITGDVWEKCFDGSEDKYLLEILDRSSESSGKDPLLEKDRNRILFEDYVDNRAEHYRQLMMAAFFHKLTDAECDKAFKTLKYDNKTREAVVKIIRYKDTDICADRVSIKNMLNEIGVETMISVLEYKDIELCSIQDKQESQYIAAFQNLKDVSALLVDVLESNEAWSLSHLAVNGSDLIAAGIPAGKNLGITLKKILKKVIEVPQRNTKEVLLDEDFLKELTKELDQ